MELWISKISLAGSLMLRMIYDGLATSSDTIFYDWTYRRRISPKDGQLVVKAMLKVWFSLQPNNAFRTSLGNTPLRRDWIK